MSSDAVEPAQLAQRLGEAAEIEAEEFTVSGNQILVLVHWTRRGKGSGVEIEGRGAHLWRVQDGLAIRFDTYRERDEARAAARAGAEPATIGCPAG